MKRNDLTHREYNIDNDKDKDDNDDVDMKEGRKGRKGRKKEREVDGWIELYLYYIQKEHDE